MGRDFQYDRESMRPLVVCAWIVATLCPLARAQVRVAGRVTNETKTPVAGARVTL